MSRRSGLDKNLINQVFVLNGHVLAANVRRRRNKVGDIKPSHGSASHGPYGGIAESVGQPGLFRGPPPPIPYVGFASGMRQTSAAEVVGQKR